MRPSLPCLAGLLGLLLALPGCNRGAADPQPVTSESSGEACPECCAPESRSSYLEQLQKKQEPTPAPDSQ